MDASAPLLILGAGRSGTNLLAGAFAAETPRFRNLSENRYVWMYRQRDRRTEHRSAADATAAVAAYIRHHFASRRANGEVAVDKTPGNAFRIPFIAAVYPDVRIVHIIRDGRDNILSRTRQWQAQEPDEAHDAQPIRHLAGKLRLTRSRMRHAGRLRSAGALPPALWPSLLRDASVPFLHHVATGRPRHYGERIPGLAAILRSQGLDVAAAVQWRETVMAGVVDGRRLGPARYLEVRFERFLEAPVATWRGIAGFVGFTPSDAGERFLATSIRPAAARQRLSAPDQSRMDALEPHLRPALEFLGYFWHR